ncbi:MAG: hypothetical protein V4757_07420 [Pseudomonadota bacterium]
MITLSREQLARLIRLAWSSAPGLCNEDADVLRAAQAALAQQAEPAVPTEESEAEGVLRSLACWLGVGGYNALTVDAKAFERKIRDGVELFLPDHGMAARRLADAVLELNVVTEPGLRCKNLARELLNFSLPTPPAEPSPAPDAAKENHDVQSILESVYGFLASTCPEGIADEAFRIVPDSLLPHSTRSKIVPLHPEQGHALGEHMGSALEDCGTRRRTDESLTVPDAAPPAPVEAPEHGELDPRAATAHARTMTRFVQSFNGQRWGGADESVDRQNLATALDNLEETAAMLLNTAERAAAAKQMAHACEGLLHIIDTGIMSLGTVRMARAALANAAAAPSTTPQEAPEGKQWSVLGWIDGRYGTTIYDKPGPGFVPVYVPIESASLAKVKS